MVQHKVHIALLREQTFLGCERKIGMMHFFMCLCAVVFSVSLKVALITSVYCFLGWLFLSKMAREDIFYRRVYMRNLKYRSFYRAHSSFFAGGGKKY